MPNAYLVASRTLEGTSGVEARLEGEGYFHYAHLVAQVVDGQDAARRLVDAVRAVLGRQEHRQQGRVPVVGNEDALLAVQAALQRRRMNLTNNTKVRLYLHLFI